MPPATDRTDYNTLHRSKLAHSVNNKQETDGLSYPVYVIDFWQSEEKNVTCRNILTTSIVNNNYVSISKRLTKGFATSRQGVQWSKTRMERSQVSWGEHVHGM